MPQVLLNISPELQTKVHNLAGETNETTEQLAILARREASAWLGLLKYPKKLNMTCNDLINL